jgi:translocation and assembly module TamB
VSSVVVYQVEVGETFAAGAELGNMNIGVVLLSVRERRIEGSTADIDAGTIKLADGQAENVKLAKPVFVVEPSGSYRASADLSIGGGVLGSMNMGQARASVVATNRELQLNNFSAEVFKGSASGNARIALIKGGTSQVAATFHDLDIAGPLTALAHSPVPLSGRATGTVNLQFPGSDFKLASGTINTKVAAEASQDRIPLTGDVVVRADRGLFNIQQVNLQTPASKLNATGQFSFENDSNLQVALSSSDADELQTILISSGLMPEIDDQLRSYGVGLAGQLAFEGNLRGQLDAPEVNGKFSLGTLLMNGIELGSLSASIQMNAAELRISDGRLIERDGGGAQFSIVSSRTHESDTSIEATLDRANAATLLAVLPSLSPASASASKGLESNTQADVSGTIKVSGIHNAMNGNADLRLGPGRLGGEPLESMVARATFSNSRVNVENIDLRLAAGRISGSGNVDTQTKLFEFQGKAESIQLARLAALSNRPGLPPITGVADLSVKISGNYAEQDFSGYQVTFDGSGQNVTINGRDAGLVALKGRTENRQLNITFTTGIFGADQAVTANIDLSTKRLSSSLQTKLNNVDLSRIFAFVLPAGSVRVSGKANGEVTASGFLLDEDGYFSLDGLAGTATFSELSLAVEDIQLNATAPLVVRFSPSEVTLEDVRFTGPGTNIALSGTVATASGGKQNLNVTGSLNMRVLNGLSPDFFSSGAAEVAVRVNGTYESPRVTGTASVNNSSVSVLLGNERWTISNLKAALRFTANQAQIDSLTGTVGGGRVNATGGALLNGFTLAGFRVNLHGDDVTVPFPENFRSTLDADIEIKGSSREQLISGVVNLRRAEYTQDIELADLINSTPAESIEEGAELEITRTALFAALRVEGRNALVVRNNLADLVGSVSLQLDGPVSDPTISGRVTATSGTLNFRNDRYDVTRLLIDLPPSRNADPILNIQGESQIRGYRVIVNLTGPLSQPQAAVRSEPALPQADVVSLITVGQLSADDTSASILSQSSVGAATSLLTDALINAPAQRATSKLFGLTRFEINPVIGGRTGSTPAARLTLGRRISKEVMVTYSTNVTSDPNQIIALEYRVSDRLSFIAQYEQASTRRLTAQTNIFSFEIRFRKRF